MATLHTLEKKNNLELYLNDVYEKECDFKSEKEETEFIQTGIETLVQDLVDKILSDDSVHKLISDQIDEFPSLVQEMYQDKSIAEVYFTIQSDSSLQRYVAENKSCEKNVKSTLIKAGSFYDGTKNNFPDEFDFIFPLLGVRTPMEFPYHNFSDLANIICKHAKDMHYASSSEKHEVTRNLEFDRYKERHGPAYKLKFIYSNGLGEQRHLHVDLVPAYKIVDSSSQQWFVEKVKKYVEPNTFRNEILAAGSSLVVKQNLAFTEREQYFIKNILSKTHVKVYRILKYILNGHGDGEKLEDLFIGPHYTSYNMKILMIYHHEACINTDTENLGPCVLQMLEELSKYESTSDFPKFTRKTSILAEPFNLLPYLNSTITTLRSMLTLENSYWYERDKIKSVSGQYLDYHITSEYTL